MRPYTGALLDRYRIGFLRVLSKINVQLWMSEGSLTFDACHYSGPNY